MSRKALILGSLVLVMGMVTIASVVNRTKNNVTCESPEVDKNAECNSTEEYKIDIVKAEETKPKRNYSSLWFNLRGLQTRSVTQLEMGEAKELNDIYKNYPKNWIDKYVSVQLSAITKEDTIVATGLNNIFNTSQRELLVNTPLNAILNVRVSYLMKNSITEKYDSQEMVLNLTVVPEHQAVFKRGMAGLQDYMKQYDTLIRTLENFEDPTQTRVWFTVNKQGEVEDVRLTGTSGDTYLDETALRLVRDMPLWSPAINNGQVVEQEYEFTLGFPGC